MRRCILLFAALSASAQPPAPLDEVKKRAAENLARLPNYTCAETIQRFVRRSKRFPLRPKDTVRVNVAYVEGRELYGPAGGNRMDHSSLLELIGMPIGDGQFAMFVKSIFLGDRAGIGSPAAAKLNGKQVSRFDYRIPREHSGLFVQSGAGSAYVPYHGSFWVDRVTLDLVRLTIDTEPPPQLRMKYDITTIDYEPVSIAGARFLLPSRSKWETEDIFGAAARNFITFENCHEFVGESVLKFDGDSK